MGADGSANWETNDEEAGVGIFQAIDRLGVQAQEAGGFMFCEGPGSVLGIRTAAAAIRTWCALRPRVVHSYLSLALVAHGLGRPEVSVIADARRESWHRFDLNRGLARIATDELRGELITPENFRHWSTPPANVKSAPYLLSDLLPRLLNHNVFQATDAPDAFLHEDPSYARWTPHIHRAPEKRP